MSQGLVTVAARVSRRLKDAVSAYAEALGLSESRLGRIAVRLYLQRPHVLDLGYELSRLAERFPCNETELLSVAVSGEEAEGLQRFASQYGRPLSQVLTLALADVLGELKQTVLEEAYRIGPMKNLGKAIEAGIVDSTKPVNEKKPERQTFQRPNDDLTGLAVIAGLAAIAVGVPTLWFLAQLLKKD
jgi:hypothetical protein